MFIIVGDHLSLFYSLLAAILKSWESYGHRSVPISNLCGQININVCALNIATTWGSRAWTHTEQRSKSVSICGLSKRKVINWVPCMPGHSVCVCVYVMQCGPRGLVPLELLRSDNFKCLRPTIKLLCKYSLVLNISKYCAYLRFFCPCQNFLEN